MNRITAEQAGWELEFLSGKCMVTGWSLFIVVSGVGYLDRYCPHFPLWVSHEAIPTYPNTRALPPPIVTREVIRIPSVVSLPS